ncbi:MAG: SO_0444 family Cu/Zn efflux transporter [Proteobacteria bacterium]|nr:SO_0444 family Cu/Zn efflux transporter [Pseudomonadota bacterium]MBU4295706.1 SO_0444 family Cu/Zn efflux transporter [Pseudomonadota bacterium]MCG2747233.1 SO_0444 family Cu/Zn efflux transporter [Desulfobulbaceae bacterium]
MEILSFSLSVIREAWNMLADSSVYVLFGLLVGGMLKMFLSPAYVAHHLGKGRFRSVLNAALLGIPIPLCSCGVLPAAASLKKQGANNGATAAFLISTPESGVDSISISYALLDPIMTIARPLAAFLTALVAGFSENIMNPPQSAGLAAPDLRCQVDNCCSGENCPPEEHAAHHSLPEKMTAGLRYAKDEIWGDLAGWFFLGLLAAGLITVLVPDEQISLYLGGGLSAMLLMLVFGIPLYICATASTPIAAAMILKGVSPGAALVFLLVGPATNITSMSVLLGLLGKRATALYLLAISVVSVGCGLLLDFVYQQAGISAKAAVGQAAELLPVEVRIAGALILLFLSVRPLAKGISKLLFNKKDGHCTCGECCSPPPPVPFPALGKTVSGKGKRE